MLRWLALIQIIDKVIIKKKPFRYASKKKKLWQNVKFCWKLHLKIQKNLWVNYKPKFDKTDKKT